jgi:hypothetical protein
MLILYLNVGTLLMINNGVNWRASRVAVRRLFDLRSELRSYCWRAGES